MPLMLPTRTIPARRPASSPNALPCTSANIGIMPCLRENCMSIELGSLATATKSAGVRVIPMDSMRAASAAVNDSVVKKLKVDGRLSAMAMNRTVPKGKSVVAAFADYFGRICFGNNNLTVAIRAAHNRLRCPPSPLW